MTSLIRPLGIAVGLTVALVAAALVLGQAVQVVLAWALIIFAVVDLWAAWVFWVTARSHRELEVLQRDFRWAAEIAIAAALIAVLAVNYLLSNPFPKGTGFVLLSVAVLLQDVPLALFLLSHYRRSP